MHDCKQLKVCIKMMQMQNLNLCLIAAESVHEWMQGVLVLVVAELDL